MTTAQATRSGKNMLLHNPALGRSNWLPEGLWPELDELHAEHEERLRHVSEATHEAAEVRRRFEDEDAEQIRAHKEGGKPPKLTAQAEREDALRAVTARAKAERQALAEFIVKAVEAIEAHEAEWLADLERQDHEAENKRKEAKRLLAEAERVVGEAQRTRSWVRRTAAGGIRPPLGHVPHESLGVPAPDQLGAEDLARAMGGWGHDDDEGEPESDGEWLADEPGPTHPANREV